MPNTTSAIPIPAATDVRSSSSSTAPSGISAGPIPRDIGYTAERSPSW